MKDFSPGWEAFSQCLQSGYLTGLYEYVRDHMQKLSVRGKLY